MWQIFRKRYDEAYFLWSSVVVVVVVVVCLFVLFGGNAFGLTATPSVAEWAHNSIKTNCKEMTLIHHKLYIPAKTHNMWISIISFCLVKS